MFGCFSDASKAFDLVDHGKLCSKLLQRGLPYPIVRFLVNWYSSQMLKVRWGNCLSDPIGVSNGVRQGSVLSPILFSVYLDDLLEDLSQSGVGCYWGHMFAGALCYADDLVLLAPCASALRHMLSICSYYARVVIMVCCSILVKLSVFILLRVVFFCRQLLSIILCSLTEMKSFILVMCFRMMVLIQ